MLPVKFQDESYAKVLTKRKHDFSFWQSRAAQSKSTSYRQSSDILKRISDKHQSKIYFKSSCNYALINHGYFEYLGVKTGQKVKTTIDDES